MTETQASGPPPRKLLAGGAVKIRLAAASGAVLVAGALLAPRAAPTTPLTTPQELAAPLLEQQAQLREVARPFRGVQEIAARVQHLAVAIPPPPPPRAVTRSDFSDAAPFAFPAGFGVFVSDAYILTHAAALSWRTLAPVITADGRTLDARFAAYEPSTGLVLLETGGANGPAAPLASAAPEPGALVVGSGRWDSRDVAVPMFVTSVAPDRYRIGALDGLILPGMPIYNLEGELVALAAGDGRDGTALPVRASAERLRARAVAGERLGAFGLAFQDLDEALARSFGDRGVLISRVIGGSPADRAGILAGDVLLAVGERGIASEESAAAAVRSAVVDQPATLHLLRGGQPRAIEVVPAALYEVAALARAGGDTPAGVEARLALPAAALEQAGIPPAARVLTMNGRAVTAVAQAQRELKRGRAAVPVLLRHDGEQFFAVIEPAR